MRPLGRVLLVEGELALARALTRVIRSIGAQVVETCPLDEAPTRIGERYDLILLDVRLSDGSGVALAEQAARLRPAPIVIAMSSDAAPREAFRLAQVGVAVFLPKPVSIDEVKEAVESARTHAPRIEPFASACVGRANIREVQNGIRKTMLEDALALADGNRSHAARLLRVSRQAVQSMLREAPRERAKAPPKPA